MFRRWTLTTLAFATVLPAGCGGRLFHRKCDSSPPPRTDRPRDDSPAGVIPPRDTIPPSSLPTTPGPRLSDPTDPGGRRLDTYRLPRLGEPANPYLPPASVPYSPSALPDQPSESKKFVEPEPVRPKKLILVPDDVPDSSSQSKYSPKSADGLPLPDRSVLLDPVGPSTPADPKPERSAGPLPTPPFPDTPRTSFSSPKTAPAGLPGYTEVAGERDVASGRKPTTTDGFDWLQRNGFKAVLYLHPPAADTSSLKAVCETRGLRLIGVPVAANKVKEAVAAFDAALADDTARPLYVCDDAGAWAGAVWYAHFRTAGSVNPDSARVRAGHLGLKEDDADQKPAWQAVQDYLQSR